MSLSVYLVHWHAPEWCADASRSLLASEGISVRLTVVDNGSGADQPELAEVLPEGVRVVTLPSNSGYTGGANAALQEWLSATEEDHVLIGSHDLHVRPGTLARLVGVALRSTEFGILGPELADRGYPVHHGSPDEPVELDWVSGSALLIARGCVQDVGLLDPRFGSYLEDVDYSWRARRAGWKIGYVPGAVAWGLGSASPRARELMQANHVLLEAKHRGALGLVAGYGAVAREGIRNVLGFVAWWRPAGVRRRSGNAALGSLRAIGSATRRLVRRAVGIERDRIG